MSTDVLLLGGLTFDEFSTPSRIGYGGRQALQVHKLPGGSRTVDLLGPDETNISFSGTFWGTGANLNAQSA